MFKAPYLIILSFVLFSCATKQMNLPVPNLYEPFDYKKAIERYSQVIKEDADNDDAYRYRGQILIYLHDYDRAIKDFTKAISLNSSVYTDYENRANAYKQLGDFENALLDYNQLLLLKPFYEMAYYSRGNILFILKRYDEAIMDYNWAIRYHLKDGKVYYKRGLAYYHLGNVKKAVEDLTQAIQSGPEYNALNLSERYISEYYTPLFRWRGTAFMDLKNYKQALADFEKAIVFSPKHVFSYNAVAWLLATCPDPTYRNGEKAVEMALKATAIKMSAAVMDTIAAAYAESGMFENAIESQKKAIGYLKTANRTEDIGEYLERLDLYISHNPYRE